MEEFHVKVGLLPLCYELLLYCVCVYTDSVNIEFQHRVEYLL